MVLMFKDSIVAVATNRLRVMLRKVLLLLLLLLLPAMAMTLVARISRDGDEYDVGVEVLLALTSSAASAAGALSSCIASEPGQRRLHHTRAPTQQHMHA